MEHLVRHEKDFGGDRHFPTLVEALAQVIFTLDDKGRLTGISPGCYDILGMHPGELIGRQIRSLVVPEESERLCKKYREVMHGGSYPSDYRVTGRDGSIRHVRAVSCSFTSQDGKAGVMGIVSEVHNCQNTEDALRQSEEKIKRIIECSNDGILLVDETGTLLEWNPAMTVISGLSRSDVMGKKVWDIQYSLLPEGKRTQSKQERLRDLVLPIIRTGSSPMIERSFEHELQRPDMTLRNIESFLFPIPTEKGFRVGGILRDITECKRADAALRDANRKLNLMSSITRHDINNQLTIFSGYLSLLESGTPALKTEEIVTILNRANLRIQRILKFTKEYQDVGVKAPLWQNLEETILSAQSTAEAAHIRLLLDPACSGVEILADPMLVRVFYNLIDNSLRHGEKVTEIRFRCAQKKEGMVIVYEDNGVGIGEKIRPVLFERGKGKNTGYGMFLIREILAITGFTITETGEPPVGARFEIAVPGGLFRVVHRDLSL